MKVFKCIQSPIDALRDPDLSLEEKGLYCMLVMVPEHINDLWKCDNNQRLDLVLMGQNLSKKNYLEKICLKKGD